MNNKNKYEYLIENNHHRLIIKNCEPNDQAEYEICVVDPEDFDLSSKAKLEIESGNYLLFWKQKYYIHSFFFI